MDNKFLETIRHAISRLGIGTITDAWHQILSLKSSSDSVINTLGFSPVFLDLIISVRLMTNKFLGSLVDKLLLLCWNDHVCSGRNI